MNVIRQNLVRLAIGLLASLPALWLLTHPIPPSWLIPFARDPNAPGYVPSHFWPVILACLVPSILALRSWKGRKAITFCWIALLYSVWQAYCFNTAAHPARNPLLLWGVLPNTDSHYYLNNAVEIAEGIGIRSGFGARQLWPGFLALLHTLCNGDLKLMLSLLTLIQAAIAFVSWELVLKLLGRSAAFIWLCCVTLFYRNYVAGVLSTEQLGLSLGMLAAVTLLYGWRKRAFVSWLFGLAFLTFALSARPGCYFVLASLVVGTFRRFSSATGDTAVVRRRLWDLSWRNGTIACALIAICLAANTISFVHLVNPPRMASNFWFTVYGSAKGGSWATAMRDLGGPTYSPDQLPTTISDEGLRTLAKNVKQAAIKEITANPGSILHTTWRAWKHLVVNATFFLEASAKWWGLLLLFVSAAALILYVAKGEAGLIDGGLYLLVWLGVILSLPFAPPWDSGDRAFAATNPLVWLTPAAFFASCARFFPSSRSDSHQLRVPALASHIEKPAMLRFSALAGTLLILCSVLLPSILLEVNRNRTMPRYSDLISLETESEGTRKVAGELIRENRGIRIAPPKSRTFLPSVAREDFERGLPLGRHRPIGELMKQLPDGTYIALLGKPRYLFCDSSVFQKGHLIPQIELQDSSWMAYKYIVSVSNNLRLTDRQTMLLCPSPASHELFWRSANSDAPQTDNEP